MTRQEVIEKLVECQKNDDIEMAHIEADTLLTVLLSSLGYDDVVAAYDAVRKWYA